MAELSEGRHAGEFILSVGNGNVSFDNGTLAEGEDLAAGTVLALVGDEWMQLDPDASSAAQQDAAGILLDKVDASAAAKPCVVVVRQCEVNINALVWIGGISDPAKAAAVEQLKALGVVAR